MPKYTYKGKNIYGDYTEGVFDAPNEQAVSEMLKSKNFYALEIKPLVEKKDLLDFTKTKKIPIKDMMLFCKQFAMVLKAGVPMIHALNLVSQQMNNKTLKKLIADLIQEIQMGASLTDAMKNHVDILPPLMIYMIEAGEVSGNLDKSLDVLQNNFKKSYNISKKVKSALSYPILVSVVAVVVVAFLMIVVVPVFTSMFAGSGSDLPGVTKALISISDFFVNNWLYLLVFCVGLLMLFKVYSNTLSGGLKVDRLKLKIPPFSTLNLNTVSARFARTMTTLLSSGVGIIESLDITAKVVSNKYVADELQNVRRQVIASKGLYGPLKETHCFPVLLETMVMIGEESGTIEAMLENAAELFEDEVDTAAQRLTDMLQPVVIVVLGGIVGFIVLAVALPIFSMY